MLAQLICRSFRNLEEHPWRPGPGCHIILGPNGAGKTSLLEAIYLLATTRSFRTSRAVDCARHGGERFHIEGEASGLRRVRLVVGLGAEGRYREVNGSSTSLVEHLQVLPIVAWSAEAGEIFTGSPERRRRFVDQGVVGCTPMALQVLSRYRRALVQKRHLLARGDKGLRSWNEVVADAASDLMALRGTHVRRLSATLRQIVSEVGVDLPDLSLEYRPSIRVHEPSAAAVVDALDRRARDEESERRPLVGPHRDEVEIRWGPHGVRQVGSAGERKALGLLLTAAQGQVMKNSGKSPIVLLDDADSELDRGRLAAIWRPFAGSDQVFVSSNRRDVWEVAEGAKRWEIDSGCMEPARDSRNE